MFVEDTLVEFLGEGSFGKVYRCQKKNNDYAIKQIDETKISAQMEQDFNFRLNSKFLVRYIETFYVPAFGVYYVVMELWQKGDLKGLIQKFKDLGDCIINPSRLRKIVVQLALGLHELHHYKIFHRNLRPENIFVDEQNNCKISDFGCSKQLDTTSGQGFSTIVTPAYESPEVIDGQPYNSASDMWALGVLIYEICTLEQPFVGTSILQLGKVIGAGQYKPIPKYRCPDDEIVGIVASLLTVNPTNRPSAPDLLKMPYIQQAAREHDLLQYFPPNVVNIK